MRIWIHLLLNLLSSVVKLQRPGGLRAIVAENALLKQQLIIANGKNKRCPNLSLSQRVYLGFLGSFISGKRLSKIAVIFKPETLLKFHRALVKKKYSLLYSPKSRKKPGPRGPSQELINLIIEMKRRNPRYGCRRIAMQISRMFEIAVDKDIVRRVLEKHYKPERGGGPSWLTFLGHTKDSLWSVDMFRVESILLNSYWVMVVMDQFTRKIIGFSVHCGDLNGIAVCCMFNRILSNKTPPKFLSSDNDPLFQFHRWKANLRIIEVEEIKSVPYAPMTHPFIERVILTVRSEFLNHLLFWNGSDFLNKLNAFKEYYNAQRSHWSLNSSTPNEYGDNNAKNVIDINGYHWKTYSRGLFQLPIAA